MDVRFFTPVGRIRRATVNLESMLARYRASVREWLPEFLLVLLVLAFLVGMLTACASPEVMKT